MGIVSLMGEIGTFSWRVIDVIQKLIAEKGITDAEVISRSGVPRNTFYRKMRGDTALTTDDIERLASALDVDPFAIIHAASAQNITPLHRNVPTAQDTIDHVETPDLERYDYAAKRGVRKVDQEPWAE